jgi:ornithine cyclodeaminase/alanine dehydrogenase-like protein (mu-crystallin family)
MTMIIGEPQTRKLIDMARAVKLLEGMFRDRAAGKLRSLPRRRLKGSQKQLNVMASWHEDWDLICLRSYAAKSNTVTLYSGRTGQIQAIINMAYMSSLRTGAATGVAARYLAPTLTQTLGVIGPGWQATFQVEAVARACPVKRVLVYGRKATARKEFIRQMKKVIDADWQDTDSLEWVESESDILVVATNSSSPVSSGQALKNQVLVASIGANQPVKHEISNDLVRQMDYIVTDDLPTAKIDSGDLIAACEAGILFQSNGIADEDLAVGRYVLEQAKKKKIKVRRLTEI